MIGMQVSSIDESFNRALIAVTISERRVRVRPAGALSLIGLEGCLASGRIRAILAWRTPLLHGGVKKIEEGKKDTPAARAVLITTVAVSVAFISPL